MSVCGVQVGPTHPSKLLSYTEIVNANLRAKLSSQLVNGFPYLFFSITDVMFGPSFRTMLLIKSFNWKSASMTTVVSPQPVESK